jgi:hypothetical protein
MLDNWFTYYLNIFFDGSFDLLFFINYSLKIKYLTKAVTIFLFLMQVMLEKCKRAAQNTSADRKFRTLGRMI